MVNSRQKGAKAEALVANMLTRHTQLPFVGTPGSGSGKIKGDLYLNDTKIKSLPNGLEVEGELNLYNTKLR